MSTYNVRLFISIETLSLELSCINLNDEIEVSNDIIKGWSDFVLVDAMINLDFSIRFTFQVFSFCRCFNRCIINFNSQNQTTHANRTMGRVNEYL